MRNFSNTNIVYLSACFVLALLQLNGTSSFGQSQISGRVMNAQNKQALAFVNIGIRGKDIGCISMEDGRFELSVPKEHLSDSLTFSYVGYREKTFLIRDLLKNNENRVELLPISTDLPEVEISAKDRWKTEQFGMPRQFGMQVNFQSLSKNYTSAEIGQKLDLGSEPHKINSFNIYLAGNLSDSLSFRINFYAFEGSQPGERVYNREILVTQSLKRGWQRIDLEPHNIWLEGKVLVAIEFLKTKNGQGFSPWIGGVTFSKKGISYYRSASMGHWAQQEETLSIYVEAKRRIRKG